MELTAAIVGGINLNDHHIPLSHDTENQANIIIAEETKDKKSTDVCLMATDDAVYNI